MRKALYYKFIMAYVLLAILGIFVTAALGSQLVENRLIRIHAGNLYAEVTALVNEAGSRPMEDEEELQEFYEILRGVAAGDHADIRMIDTKGCVRMNTARSFDFEREETIRDFDYTSFGPQYYEVSCFFDQYPEEHLNVLIPLASQMTTRGYLSVSTPMTRIVQERDALLGDVYIVVTVNFVLSLMILFLFTFSVYRPLGKITEGARQFASGNLTHKIDLVTNDEMGYLADTMNFMADELKKNSDYQKKFISNVSHDFRSPLTSIKGFSEAMCDGTIPPEMHEHYLKIITGEASRLEKLTRSVLMLNNMDQDEVILNRVNFDINEMLRSTAAVFEGSCRKKKISIELILSGSQFMVNADRDRIEQVVYNLLDNAVKFSPRSSTIWMETTERHGKCYVSVKDEGCGIAKKDLTNIWDRFYKADQSRGRDKTGTGLGLSIVKEILTAHGQNISVVSTENVGTEFTFTLQLAARN